MHCPGCTKFASFEGMEPEWDEPAVFEDGHITGQVRIIPTCEDCGEELKETIFEIAIDSVPWYAAHADHGVTMEEPDLELIDRVENRSVKTGKSLLHSWQVWGAACTFHLTCSCGETTEEDWQETIAQTQMESLV